MGTLHPGQHPPAPASTLPGSAKIIGARDDGGGGPGPYVMSCETLVGDALVNAANEELGVLAHVMIEVPGGRIAYAVLARGGVLGLGERLYAVPWSILTLDAERRCFVMEIDRERLDQAPGFDRGHWPAMADPAWERAVQGFYARRGE